MHELFQILILLCCYQADGDIKSPLKNSEQTYREKLEQDLNTVSTISKLTESVSVSHQVRVRFYLSFTYTPGSCDHLSKKRRGRLYRLY